MAASTPPLSDVEQRLRLSADSNALNLAALRTRAADLHRKLDDAQRRLAGAPPDAVVWADVVAAFGVLSAGLGALSAEVRPLAKHYALYPAAAGVAAGGAWWREAALPNMHATRLEVGQEAEGGSDAQPCSDDAFALDRLQQQCAAHDAACAAALAVVAARRTAHARFTGAARVPGVAQPAAADTARLLAAATWGEGLRRR